MMFGRAKRGRVRGFTQKLEIEIDFANVTRSRESFAERLGMVPDDCLADAGTARVDVSVEFLKRLHGLEDTRG
jgi:hypothetical protein